MLCCWSTPVYSSEKEILTRRKKHQGFSAQQSAQRNPDNVQTRVIWASLLDILPPLLRTPIAASFQTTWIDPYFSMMEETEFQAFPLISMLILRSDDCPAGSLYQTGHFWEHGGKFSCAKIILNTTNNPLHMWLLFFFNISDQTLRINTLICCCKFRCLPENKGKKKPTNLYMSHMRTIFNSDWKLWSNIFLIFLSSPLQTTKQCNIHHRECWDSKLGGQHISGCF